MECTHFQAYNLSRQPATQSLRRTGSVRSISRAGPPLTGLRAGHRGINGLRAAPHHGLGAGGTRRALRRPQLPQVDLQLVPVAGLIHVELPL